MKSTTFSPGRLLWVTAVAGLCITLAAFRQQQQKPAVSPQSRIAQDTIPEKKERKIRDLDEALEELDNVKIEAEMEKVNIELAKIKPQIEKELARAKVEVEKALKEIDMAKINAEVNDAVAKIDCEKINREIKAAMAEIDWAKIKSDINEAKEVNLDKLDIEMKKVDVELKKIKPEIEKNIASAKVEIEKAKKELKEYKEFVDGLDNDGLIDKKGEYTIKHSNGELIINDKVQPEAVYNKYRSFLEKHKTLTIKKSAGDFDIDND